MADRVLRVAIMGDTKSLEAALRKGQNATDEFDGRMGKFRASMERATPGSEALAAGIGAVGLAVAGAVGFGIKLAADLEQAEIAFGTMLGSADAAKKMIADLQKFAAETPFEFPEIQAGARNLLAFGVAAGEIPETLRRLGDISAGVNIPLGELSAIFGKAKVQGRLFMQDINQLTGRGIPIIAELAKQFGVAESEIRGMVEKGKIGFPELNRAFTSLTAEGSRFGGMMEAQSQSVAGLFSTMKDSVSMSLAEVGKAFIETFKVKDAMREVSAAVGELTEKMRVAQATGQTFTQALVGLIPPDTQRNIVIVAGAITAAPIPAFVKLGAAIVAATLPLLPFLAAGAAVAAMAHKVASNWEMRRPTFRAVEEDFLDVGDSLEYARVRTENVIPPMDLAADSIGRMSVAATVSTPRIAGVSDATAGMARSMDGAARSVSAAKAALQEQASVVDITAFKLRQMESDWRKYTLTTTAATDSTEFLTAQKESLQQRMDLAAQKTSLLRERFESAKAASGMWTAETMRLKENLSAAALVELGFGRQIEETTAKIRTRIHELERLGQAAGRTHQDAFRDALGAVQAGLITGEDARRFATEVTRERHGQQAPEALWADLKRVYHAATPQTLDHMFRTLYGISPPPGLAEGGIVTRPTLALIGERGREAVIPLDRGGYGNTVTINVYGQTDPERTAAEVVRRLRRAGVRE